VGEDKFLALLKEIRLERLLGGLLGQETTGVVLGRLAGDRQK
jgi:hypothetical protein